MAGELREELIDSAVSFLRDPQVAGSPLTKRVQFLESKELTEPEIQEALRRAGSAQSVAPSVSPSGTMTTPTYPLPQIMMAPPPPPPLPERNWKDYFVMATVSVGVTYGLYEMYKRYVAPVIVPPSKAGLEADKEAVAAEFEKVEAQLNDMAVMTQSIQEENAKENEKIESAVKSIESVIELIKQKVHKTDEDIHSAKLEIQNLKYSLEKNSEKQSSLIASEMETIQAELKSLKSLINTRRAAVAGGSATATPSYTVPPVSSIPSVADILKRNEAAKEAAKETVNEKPKSDSSEDTKPVNPAPISAAPTSSSAVPQRTGIPAWQLAAQDKQ